MKAMYKIMATLFALIMGASSTAMADNNNYLSVENFTAEAGSQVVMPILMTNNEQIAAFQVDLYLPSGVTLAENEYGVALVEIATNRTTTKHHAVSYKIQPDGAIRIVVTSPNNNAFSGTRGAVLNVTLNIASNIGSGNKIVLLNNQELVSPNLTAFKTSSKFVAIIIEPAPINVGSLVLNQTSMSLVAGQNSILTASVLPLNATNKNILWSSSNTAVATVANGIVSAIAPGSTVISATAADDSGICASCSLTVTRIVSGITINKSSLSMSVGQTSILSATVTPSDASNKNIEWTTSNPIVATVENGVVFAKANGTAVITASATDGSEKKAKCNINVSNLVSDINLNTSHLEMSVGQTATLMATVSPSDATNKSIIWESSDPAIAIVENGIVTAKTSGFTYIIARAADGSGKSITCSVNVAHAILESRKIIYTTIDGQAIVPYDMTGFGSNIRSNAYIDGHGEIVFDGDVTSIGMNAFARCSTIASITLPSTVSEISDYAFYECVNLSSVELPKDLSKIGNFAFSGCSNLSSIAIPENVSSIGNYAFGRCKSLTYIILPETTAAVGRGAFDGCSGLVTAQMFGAKTIGSSAFYDCVNLTSVKMSGTETIGSNAFCGCEKLASIALPNTLHEIEYNAFSGCNRLSVITCDALEPPHLASNVFSSYGTSIKLYVPFEAINEYKNTDFWNYFGVKSSQYPETYKIYYTTSDGNAINHAGFIDGCHIESNIYENGQGVILLDGEISSIDQYFNYCPNLTSIVLPGKLTTIKNAAFQGCTNLTSIIIPEDVNSIGDYAFYGCTSLTSISLPENVASIGGWAFYECSSLKTILIPVGVSKIETSSFENCSQLESVLLPKSLISIAKRAFYGCKSLSNVEFPQGITSIGETAFYECSSLTSIFIPKSVASIGSIAFGGCSNIAYVECESTTPIDIKNVNEFSCTFVYVPFDAIPAYKAAPVWNHFTITSRLIPETCKIYYTSTSGNIIVPFNRNAFGANILTNTYENGQGVIAFDGDVNKIGENAFSGKEDLSSIIIPIMITSIADNAFANCRTLTSIQIPENVSEISSTAFATCENLVSISVDENNTFYDSRENCNAIIYTSTNELIRGCENTIIPENVMSIGKLAFNSCKNLELISIPENVKSIGARAFGYCNKLARINIPNGVEIIEDYTFAGCSALREISVPEGITKLGNYALYNCNNLTSIVLPKSLAIIGESALDRCRNLTSINIPEGVVSIGEDALYDCENLQTITVDEKNTVYDSRNNCNAIVYTSTNELIQGCVSTVIPEDIAKIGNFAFEELKNLTSITIPASVNYIGNAAFYNCTSMESLSVKNLLPPTLGRNVFKTYGTLHVYPSAVEAYQNTEVWSNFNIIGDLVALATFIELDENSLSMTAGDCTTLSATILPLDASKLVLWTSSNEDVVIVDNGVITAVASGTATITATAADGSGVKAICEVTVTKDLSTEIAALQALVASAQATCNNAVEGTAVGNYNAGAKAALQVIIDEVCTAISVSMTEAYIARGTILINDALAVFETMKVKNLPVASITLDNSTLTITEGNSATLTATIAPEDATNKTIIWTSSNEDIATVSNGTITAVAPGTATITATAVDGSGVKATCEVSVTKDLSAEIAALQSLVASAQTVCTNAIEGAAVGNYNVGAKAALQSVIDEVNATISASMTDEQITAGTAKINNALATFEAAKVIFQPVASITLNNSTLTITEGNSATLTATIAPEDASNKAITWTSSNEDVATVENGTITAVAPGTATITATAADGSGVKATCEVTVTKDLSAEIAALQTLVASAQTTCTNAVEGTAVGNYNSGAKAALQAVINEVSATISASMTETQITEGTTKINDALAAFEAEKVTSSSGGNIEDYENVVFVEDAEGAAGSQIDLSVMLNNTDDISDVQFDLYLPAGVTIAVDEDDYELIDLSTDRTTSKRHTVDYQVQPDGSMRIMCTSSKGLTFNGNEGSIVTVTVNISDDMEEGQFPIILKNIVTSNFENTYVVPQITTTLTITNFVLGDINADGAINVGDLSRLAHMILNNYSEYNNTFKAADINGDHTLNVGDYSRLVQMILGATASSKSFAGGILSKKYETAFAQVETNDITLAAGQQKQIAVRLNNNGGRYSAMQFDLTLPEGITLADDAIQTAARTTGFSANTNGSRVILHNMRNAAIDGTEGDVLYLTIKSDRTMQIGSYEIGVDNIILATTESEVVRANGFNTLVQVDDLTAIGGIEAGNGLTVTAGNGKLTLTSDKDQNVRVYASIGTIVADEFVAAGKTKTLSLVPGVYIINNVKITIK